jgi:hypothetical protein
MLTDSNMCHFYIERLMNFLVKVHTGGKKPEEEEEADKK